MTTDIIQHHTHVDFESIFEEYRPHNVNIDLDDFSNFLRIPGVKHSFMGCAESKNRVRDAIKNAIGSDEAAEIVSRASSVMVVIIRSSEANCPLTIREMQYLNEFVEGLPKNSEVECSLAEDVTLGNAIKVVVLANIAE